MATLLQRLALVRRLPRGLRLRALSAALDVADAPEAGDIALELLAQHRAAGARASAVADVFRAWARLSPAARFEALGVADEALSGIVRTLARSPSPDDRASIAAVLTEAWGHGTSIPKPEAASLLGILVTDENERVTRAALDALVRACRDDLGGDEPEHECGRLLSELEAALVVALRGYGRHRHDGVIGAALRVAHRAGPVLGAWLDDEHEPGHLALRASARRVTPRRGAAMAPYWLAVRPLAGVAAEWLELGGEESQTRLLERAHLLMVRDRLRSLRRMRAPERLIPGDARLADDPAPLRRASIRLARWVAKPDRRLLHLSGFLADPEPLTRLHAVMALALEPAGHLVDQTLTDFALDSDGVVSWSSACVMGGAQSRSRRAQLVGTFRTLLRSPHARTRLLAEQVLREFDPLAPGEGGRMPDAAQARLAHRADPVRFMELARLQLGGDSTRNRVWALEMIHRLGLAGELRSELPALLSDRDQRVAAKAVCLLRELGDPGSRASLRGALDHADPRVRADALEALGRSGEMPELARYMDDDSPRVRGNAVRLGIESGMPGAASELGRMLVDARAGHRLAGLWVAEVTARIDELPVVTDLAASDQDADVRRRAARCMRRLSCASNVGWLMGSGAESRGWIPAGRHAEAGA